MPFVNRITRLIPQQVSPRSSGQLPEALSAAVERAIDLKKNIF
jgi:hypothetical protein